MEIIEKGESDMIEYKHIYKKYDGKTIIDDLNLTINDGEFVVLIGPSGCGKTTTLKMINRLIEMDSGSIHIDGQNIKEIEKTKLRTGIGYVIQQIGLFPNMTVEENIAVVPKLLKWSKEKTSERVKELLELVGMPYEENAKKYPNELSGGQQQRIGVLRALAAQPPIILMDEPFGALDPITRDALQDEVKALQQKLNKTIIFVTHDMDEAIKLADVIVFMEHGKIIQQASPEEMLRAPASEAIRKFMGKSSAYTNGDQLLCSDIMKKDVFKVSEDKKTLECIELMKHRNIDSVIVVDENRKYYGVTTIEDIRTSGKPGEKISTLAKKNVTTVKVDSDAKIAIDILTKSKMNYLVVLNDISEVVGIITKTSITRSLASVVWGEHNE